MEIKTKYNIGDKVWVLSGEKPTKIKIVRIDIHVIQNYPTAIEYNGWFERYVYPTKEELLKLL